jgi:hypothetical protein
MKSIVPKTKDIKEELIEFILDKQSKGWTKEEIIKSATKKFNYPSSKLLERQLEKEDIRSAYNKERSKLIPVLRRKLKLALKELNCEKLQEASAKDIAIVINILMENLSKLETNIIGGERYAENTSEELKRIVVEKLQVLNINIPLSQLVKENNGEVH